MYVCGGGAIIYMLPENTAPHQGNMPPSYIYPRCYICYSGQGGLHKCSM